MPALQRPLLAALTAIALALGACQTEEGVPAAGPVSVPAAVRDHGDEWPLPNADYASTRSAPTSSIDASNVHELGVAWAFEPIGSGAYGAFAGGPLIAGGVIYTQDLAGNVAALDFHTGEVLWTRLYARPMAGPNGPALGEDRLFVPIYPNLMVALDLDDGEELWRVALDSGTHQAVAAGDLVFAISDAGGYVGGYSGMVYALDAESGRTVWEWQVVEEEFWGNPEVNSGGGVWLPPSLDPVSGRLYVGTGNPAPFPGTAAYPNATSRAEPNLHANSLAVLDHSSGALLWYDYVQPNDLFDHDFHVSPVLVDGVEVQGHVRDLVIGAGKNGRVIAWDRHGRERLWETPVGIHENADLEQLRPGEPVRVHPGFFGGVLTPMALGGELLYVPVVNLPTEFEATGFDADDGMQAANNAQARTRVLEGSGELVAIDITTGDIRWSAPLGSPLFGGATVVNDLVFTATFAGVIHAFERHTGDAVWTFDAPGGINSWPAVHGDTIAWGIGLASPPQFLVLRLAAGGSARNQ